MSSRRRRAVIASDSLVMLAGLVAALRNEGFAVARGLSQLSGLERSGQDPGVDALVVAVTNGITANIAPALKRRRDGVAAVVLLADVSLKIHADALHDAGALCLPLTAHPSEIARALIKAHNERFIVRESLTRGAGGRLTAREQEILDEATSGATNPQIAGALGISAETVKDHLRSAYRKLRVRNRTEAVAAYLESTAG